MEPDDIGAADAMTTVTIIVLALAAVSLGIVYYAVRGHVGSINNLDGLQGNTTPIDLVAFRNLVDIGDRQFLQEQLSPESFNRIERKRILACIAYVQCAARNAAILARIGTAAEASTDPRIRASGRHLAAEAVRLRVFSGALLLRLYVSVLFPEIEFSVASLSTKYSQLTQAVGQLSQLEDPASTSRVLAAL